MPQYSFECQACGKPFDIAISMSEYAAMRKNKGIACPECGLRKAVRIFTAPAVMVKNSAGNARAGDCGPGCCCR